MLDEAGWTINEQTGIREKDGQPLTLLMTYESTETMNKPIATPLQSMLAEVGIELTTAKDPEHVQEIITGLLTYSSDNVIDIPFLYARDVIVYNENTVGGYNFPDNSHFFEADSIKDTQ